MKYTNPIKAKGIEYINRISINGILKNSILEIE